jgi:hypothetical protein
MPINLFNVLAVVLLTTRTLGQDTQSSRRLAALSYEKQHIGSEAPAESWVREAPKTRGGDSSSGSGKTANRGGGAGKWNASKASRHHLRPVAANNDVLLFVHIAKTGGSSFDEILKGGVNSAAADCIVEKKHYEDRSVPLTDRYDFPNCKLISTEFSRFQVTKFLVPKTRKGSPPPPSLAPAALQLPHVKYLTLLREPFARLLSQVTLSQLVVFPLPLHLSQLTDDTRFDKHDSPFRSLLLLLLLLLLLHPKVSPRQVLHAEALQGVPRPGHAGGARSLLHREPRTGLPLPKLSKHDARRVSCRGGSGGGLWWWYHVVISGCVVALHVPTFDFILFSPHTNNHF